MPLTVRSVCLGVATLTGLAVAVNSLTTFSLAQQTEQSARQEQLQELDRLGIAKVAQKPAQKWLYKVSLHSTNTQLESILNRMAEQGWEFDEQILIPVDQSSTRIFNSRLVFRKPAP